MRTKRASGLECEHAQYRHPFTLLLRLPLSPPLQLDGLSVSQMKELREKAEKYTFEAEVNKMMRLIINSLYRNKEVRVCVGVLVCVCSAMFGMM